ncbi:MAG: M23 family metallopeptidase [Treponema sp.]|nr:M23 family metallopeptidase [Treponema sp.]
MKDIIASQHVYKRPKVPPAFCREGANAGTPYPSGASAVTYRSLTEQSFIEMQKLPRKKKKALRSILAALTLPDVTGRTSWEEEQRGVKKRPGKAVSFFTGESPVGKIPVVCVCLLCLVLTCLIFLGSLPYIPDPEPPEDSLLRETLVSGVDRPWAAFRVSGPAGGAQGDEIPLDLTENFAWREYIVGRGDTVEGIAKRYGLSLDAVIASNELRNVKRELRAGQKIRIPNMDGIPYTIKKGDSYAGIAKSMDVPLEAVLDANDIQSDAIGAGTVLFIPGARMNKNELRQALGELFILPVGGRRTSPFGWRADPFTGLRSFHAGQDIAAPMGTPVKASADGRVSAAGYNGVYGNFVILSHSGNYQTMYAHLSRILVKKGSWITQGSVVGRVGSSGRSTGAHLHFSVYKSGRAVNPLEVLNN